MDKVDVRFPQPAAKGPPPNLPKNAEERAAALVDLMGRLAHCLNREADAIRSRRPRAELDRLVREKEPMALVYEEVARLLRVDREGMARLAPEMKERLRAMTRLLSDSVDANARAVQASADAQKMLVDTVIGAINRGRQSRQASYAVGTPDRAPAGARAYAAAHRAAGALNTSI